MQQVAGDRSADDADVVRRWRWPAMAWCINPSLTFAPDLAAGRLLRVCPEWQGEPAPLYLLCADRRQLAHRAAAARIFARTLPGAAGGRL